MRVFTVAFQMLILGMQEAPAVCASLAEAMDVYIDLIMYIC